MLDVLGRLGLQPGAYGVVTLHRPSNVDHAETLGALIDVLVEISQEMKLVFPVHPRTKGRLEAFGLLEDAGGAGDHPAAAAWVPGVPGAHVAGQGDCHRLGRAPGGIDGLGDSVFDACEKTRNGRSRSTSGPAR